MNLKRRIDAAAGRRPADLLLTNARVVSVFSDSIIRTDVAIADGMIVGFGSYRARRRIDLGGRYLCAGLVDSHLHIESTLLSPAEFARAVVPRGTTAVVADPHEIANVLGAQGIAWMIESSEGLPLDVYFGLPSCVPATELETSGARLNARALKRFVHHPRVVAIGEVMNYPGVIHGSRELLDKIRLSPDLRVDGHAPGLTGKELYAYIAAGIHSDHESTTAREAREKLMAGMHLMLREGTTEKNLGELARVITAANAHRCFFCSDDRSPRDLMRRGHVDDILRRAVHLGIPPITALQMATNNAPYYFRLRRRIGAVAIDYCADLVVFDDLRRFRARMVFKGGRLVARDGKMLVPVKPRRQRRLPNSIRIGDIDEKRLAVRATGDRMRVIEIVPGQVATRERIMRVTATAGGVRADTRRDLAKLVVVERHHRSGRVGIGFVRGFGLVDGALASSVAHDSHNIIAAGVHDADIVCAVREIVRQRGGFVVVRRGKVLARLELPIAGLMTSKPVSKVVAAYDALQRAAKSLGVGLADPFLQLSFLALPVIPEIKLTDRGLVDVRTFSLVDLFVR